MIRDILKFWLAMVVIVFSIALATEAVRADHTGDTGYWLVVLDFTAEGEASMAKDYPLTRLPTKEICETIGVNMSQHIMTDQPERSFLSACMHPDVETPTALAQIIKKMVYDFGGYFATELPGESV